MTNQTIWAQLPAINMLVYGQQLRTPNARYSKSKHEHSEINSFNTPSFSRVEAIAKCLTEWCDYLSTQSMIDLTSVDGSFVIRGLKALYKAVTSVSATDLFLGWDDGILV